MNIVLFVCDENRSIRIMAEAIVNSEDRAGWAAESAGLRRTGAVSSTAIGLLQAIGLKPTRTELRRLTRDSTDRATRIVTFGGPEGLSPEPRKKAEDWPTPRTYERPLEGRVAVPGEIRGRGMDLIARRPGWA